MKDTGPRVCIGFLLETGWFQKRNEGPSLNGMDLFSSVNSEHAHCVSEGDLISGCMGRLPTAGLMHLVSENQNL